MQVVILAAGRGSRLQNLTDDRPKTLVDINGQSILQRQLTCFRQLGLEDITVISGYLSEKIQELGVRTIKNPLWDQAEMVSSLLVADKVLSGGDSIISYGDIIFESDVINSLTASDCEMGVAYDMNWQVLWEKRFPNPLDDAETFKISTSGTILEIGQKTGDIGDIQGQYMGVFKLTANAWKKIKDYLISIGNERINTLQVSQLLNEMISLDLIKVVGIPVSNRWMEIDTQKDVEIAESIFN